MQHLARMNGVIVNAEDSLSGKITMSCRLTLRGGGQIWLETQRDQMMPMLRLSPTSMIIWYRFSGDLDQPRVTNGPNPPHPFPT